MKLKLRKTLLILITVSCISGSNSLQSMTLFDYNPQTPLDIQEISVTDKANVKIHDISYTGVNGKRIKAFLVVPQGQGPFAGVVFLHWGMGDRSQFLGESMLFAKKGILSLLIEIPFNGKEDYLIQSIINIRRAVDLLSSRKDVNVEKLGYVGHSWGATLGGILAGVEKRLKVLILMAGYPAISNKRPFPFDGANLERLDAVHFIANAAPASLLFQFAKNDVLVTKEEAIQFYEESSEPKQIKWYQTDHYFNEEKSQKYRIEWITKELKP